MGEGSRQRLPSYLSVALLVLGSPVTALAPGRDVCKSVSLAALRAASGQPYRAGIAVNGSCSWERPDLAAGMTLTSHPRPAGLALMQQFLARRQPPATRLRVPGASEAVVVRASAQSRYVFAAYPSGVVQLNMTAPRAPSNARLLRVLRLVAPRR